MSRSVVAVAVAVERWTEEGLLDPATAARLLDELAARQERERLRFARVLLSATGAAVLLIAAAAFFMWIWPSLGAGERAILIGVVGVIVTVGGAVLEGRTARPEPWYVLQAAGLLLLLFAIGYSMEAWPNRSPAAVASGVLAGLVPLVAVSLYARRSPPMAPAALLLGYAFLFLCLHRTLGYDGGTILWVIDVVFLSFTTGLLLLARDPAAPAWYVQAVAGSIFAAPLLIFFTGVTNVSGSVDVVVWALDLWLLVSVAFMLRVRHRGPAHLQVPAIESQLVLAVPIAVGLAFWTTLGALAAPPEVAALSVAAVGAVALGYALPRGEQGLLLMGALALVGAAWYYASARGQMLTGALALGFTAAVLFWLATRLGRNARGVRASPPAQTSR